MHLLQLGTDIIHRPLAFTADDDLLGGFKSRASTHVYRAFQFREFCRNQRFNPIEALLLARIISGELAQLLHDHVHRGDPRLIGCKVPVIAGDHVATLPGFRVRHLNEQAGNVL